MDRKYLVKLVQEEVKKQMDERELTKAELSRKEKFARDLKKTAPELKKRYGDDWKSVMYAIATKKAKAASDTDKKTEKESDDE
jgi:hypothetical protein